VSFALLDALARLLTDKLARLSSGRRRREQRHSRAMADRAEREGDEERRISLCRWPSENAHPHVKVALRVFDAATRSRTSVTALLMFSIQTLVFQHLTHRAFSVVQVLHQVVRDDPPATSSD
jgi:hypothetical protein